MEKTYLYFFSYFNCLEHHKSELESTLLNSLNKVFSKFDLMTEEEKIAVQKIAQLNRSSSDKIWFSLKDSSVNYPYRIWTYLQFKNFHRSLMQPHKNGRRFLNFPSESYMQHFLKAQYLLFPGACSTPYRKLPDFLVKRMRPKAESLDLNIQWIGHSCSLIQVAGMNILTDPSFGDVWPLFKRYTVPGVDLKKLPRIDTVIISHWHADHFDTKALEYLKFFQPTIFVPKEMRSWFVERGFEKVFENDWWTETVAVSQDTSQVKITSVPAYHWSQRGLLDGNHTHWSGWVIELRGKKSILPEIPLTIQSCLVRLKINSENLMLFCFLSLLKVKKKCT